MLAMIVRLATRHAFIHPRNLTSSNINACGNYLQPPPRHRQRPKHHLQLLLHQSPPQQVTMGKPMPCWGRMCLRSYSCSTRNLLSSHMHACSITKARLGIFLSYHNHLAHDDIIACSHRYLIRATWKTCNHCCPQHHFSRYEAKP